MTSRERLLCAIELGTPDRVPVTPWGLGRIPEDSELGQRIIRECDPFIGASVGGGDWFLGTEVTTRTEDRDGKMYSVIETPGGDLYSRYQRTEVTGAYVEFFCKSADDVQKLLACPYRPPEVDTSPFIARKDQIGEDGLVGAGLTNPGAIPARFLAPEDYCLLWVEHRDLFLELVRVAAERCYHWVEQACRGGVDCFRIIGGEFASTQLGPEGFRATMLEFDRPMVEIMHEHGALAHYHNHGPMGRFLEMLADIGIDSLDPLEGPPWGDTTLAECKQRIGDRVCLLGNLDDMEVLDKLDGATIEQLAEECILAAGPDGYLLGGTTSGTFTEHAGWNFLRMVEVSKRMAAG
ncbi:MAG: uroporphyrinogen decarboxylase family protein [Armatimonadota bacterium]